MHVFMTDKEYQQSAIDIVARMIFERASDIMQGGNPPDYQIDCLATLSRVAVFKDLSNTVLNTFLEMLEEENAKNDLEKLGKW